MPQILIKKKGWKCNKCSHEWSPKDGFDSKNKPKICPKCKSPNYNK